MLSSVAVAMQSIFQLPWTCDSARDKQSKLDGGNPFQIARANPTIDMSFVAGAKRKRIDTGDVLSGDAQAQQEKRFKVAVEDGAVQPSHAPAREVDAFVCVPPSLGWKAPVEGVGVAGRMKPTSSLPTSDAPAQQLTSAPAPLDLHNTFVAAPSPFPPMSKSQDVQHDYREISYAGQSKGLSMSTDEDTAQLRSVIAAQIDLEILLKHNELRLIEQELAKCQVALEQIRRCELIPYPGYNGASETVVNGVGSSVVGPHGSTTPAHPPSFGVVDGPYTRHYAQWLLPDATFESHVATPSSATTINPLSSTRSARVLAAEFNLPPAQFGRGSRNSGGSKSQLIAQDPSQPHRDPLLMKRELDGQWVRLVCTKCKPERANFQNIQGFLNHCRISHQDNYKSHEQAAIACGRVVEVDEGCMPPPPTPQVVAKYRSSLSAASSDPASVQRGSNCGTPVSERPAERGTNFSNPLAVAPHLQVDQPTLRSLVLPRSFDINRASQVSTPTTELLESPFAASPQTPHLNRLLQRKSFTGDLNAMVLDAKVRVDTSVYDCSDSEAEANTVAGVSSKRGKQKIKDHETSVSKRQSVAKTGAPAVRSQDMSAHSGLPRNSASAAASQVQTRKDPAESLSPRKQQSRKIQQQDRLRGLPSPSCNASDEEMDLSPGVTMDSNPGLVSDHEGESDDADEDVVADPGSTQAYAQSASMLTHPAARNLHAENYAGRHDNMMDIDIHVEIQDASDGERESSDVSVRQHAGLEVNCSSRAGGST